MGVGAAIGGGALLGAVAGGQKKKSSSTTTKSSLERIDLSARTEEEARAEEIAAEQLQRLNDEINANKPSEAQLRFEQLLEELTTGQISEERLQSAQQFAQDVTAPEQVALQQAFKDQEIRANRQASILGRQINDPILQARLAQEQIRQQQSLLARQTSIAANLPFNQFSIAGQGLETLNNLSQQQLQNRSSVLGLASREAARAQQFRINTASRVTTGTSNTKGKSGGGLGGILSGALGGAGLGASAFNAFGGGANTGTVTGPGGNVGAPLDFSNFSNIG